MARRTKTTTEDPEKEPYILEDRVAEPNLGSQLPGLVELKSLVHVNRLGDDGIRGLGGDTLDIHSSLGGGNHDGALRLPVVEDGKVVFAASVLALHNVHLLMRGKGKTEFLSFFILWKIVGNPTALQIRPAAPVCLVTSFWPSIFSANILASVGLNVVVEMLGDRENKK